MIVRPTLDLAYGAHLCLYLDINYMIKMVLCSFYNKISFFYYHITIKTIVTLYNNK